MVKYNRHINKIQRKYAYRINLNEDCRLDMSERVSDFPTFFFDKFISNIDQKDLICYPPLYEYDTLKQKIASYNGVSQDNVFISNGSETIIKLIYELACERTSNIITSDPCFPMHKVFASILGIEVKEVKYDGLCLNLNKIKDMIDDDTRVVIIANPNSPVGDFKSEEELSEIIFYAHSRDVMVVIDEAYADYAPYSICHLVERYDNLIVIKTLSKSFGAAGCRIGYAISNQDLVGLLDKIAFCFPISTLSIKFGIYLFDNLDVVKDYIRHVIRDRERLCVLLSEKNYKTINSHCNWLHIEKSDELVNILNKYGLSFRCVVLNGENWVRLTIGQDTVSQGYIQEMLA